jgi:Sulfotransferase domain
MNPPPAKPQAKPPVNPPVNPPAKHLVIAGVTRAGTTSLFNYLGDHPRVRRSTIKETRFFLDHDGLKRLHRYEEGLGAYGSFFPGCPPDAVRLEATPDYLFCPAAAGRIAQSLPGACVVVILREPIGRLVSWRRYAIQNGLLDAGTTLSDYIQTQFDAQASGERLDQHLRALPEGRYARFLVPWVEAFDRSRLIVCNYRDLLEDPASVVRRICGRVGIDPAYYDDYTFGIHNESRNVRWPKIHEAYRSLIWRVKPHVHDKPAVRAALRGLRRSTDAALGRTGGGVRDTTDPGGVLTDHDRRRLEDYYRQEPAELARMLDLPVWEW